MEMSLRGRMVSICFTDCNALCILLVLSSNRHNLNFLTSTRDSMTVDAWVRRHLWSSEARKKATVFSVSPLC